jgi:acyl-CoA thioester hydrolase
VTGTKPGGLPPASFSWPARVYWEDTDGGGVVYYANYLKFLERARTEWLRSLGFVQTELAKDPGIVFVVASLTIEYKRPARLDDALTVTCGYEPDGAVCLRFAQRILRGDEVLIEASVRVACLDGASFRPKRLPAALVSALSNTAARA